MKSGSYLLSKVHCRVALAALVGWLFAVPAMATTFLMATDQELVETSAAVVEARILSSDYAPGASMPSTDYFIEVEDVLSGEVTGRNLVVRVPGGESPEGIGLRLEGMPQFVVGERVLLFLAPNEDGTFGVRHFMMGAFHEVARAGHSIYVRGFQGAQELTLPGLPDRSAYGQLREAEGFRQWVEAVGRGADAEPDYFIEEEAGLGRDGDLGQVTEPFTLFSDGQNNLNIRWFDFDSGNSVAWRNEPGGQPGFSANATASAFRTGMAVWNNDNRSIVNLRYVGTTGAKTGFDNPDGVNALIYRNFDGSISSGDFQCNGNSASGTLALGGPWYCRPGGRINTPPYNGVACPAGPGANVNAAFEAEIVTNTGIECLFQILRGQPNGGQLALRAAEALFGHELGHTLGIGHSCPDQNNCPSPQDDALMFPLLHTDGRGAVLNIDDRRAVRALYPGSVSGPVPSAPTNLIAELVDGNSISLEWQDNSNDETSFVIETSIAGAGFEDLASVAADTTEYVADDLVEEVTYRFRVLARNGNGTSVPSNEVEIETELGLPAAPAVLVAETGGATSVVLTWEDRSDNEEEFFVEARTPNTGAWQEIADGIVADPDAGGNVETLIGGLNSNVPYSFRVGARNTTGDSGPSNVDAATPAGEPTACAPDATTLCLLQDQFSVKVFWRNQYSPTPQSGVGQAGELSDRSGTFWFFREDNIELIVKMLDGTSLNEFYWTFYGALSDVEYWVTVVDTESGDSRTYYNPPGEQCGQLDTASIPSDIPTDPAPLRLARIPASSVISGAAEAGSCESSATTLCLLDGRFSVEVDWDDQYNDRTGVGTAVEADDSDRTGYFWFFNEENIELVVKALDGRVVNGFYWFFYGALTDVEYEITVTDTVDGGSRVYRNEPFNQCGQFDNRAFVPNAE